MMCIFIGWWIDLVKIKIIYLSTIFNGMQSFQKKAVLPIVHVHSSMREWHCFMLILAKVTQGMQKI